MRPSEDPNQEIVKPAVEARQATQRPRSMRIVVLVSTIGAFVISFLIYLAFSGESSMPRPTRSRRRG